MWLLSVIAAVFVVQPFAEKVVVPGADPEKCLFRKTGGAGALPILQIHPCDQRLANYDSNWRIVTQRKHSLLAQVQPPGRGGRPRSYLTFEISNKRLVLLDVEPQTCELLCVDVSPDHWSTEACEATIQYLRYFEHALDDTLFNTWLEFDNCNGVVKHVGQKYKIVAEAAGTPLSRALNGVIRVPSEVSGKPKECLWHDSRGTSSTPWRDRCQNPVNAQTSSMFKIEYLKPTTFEARIYANSRVMRVTEDKSLAFGTDPKNTFIVWKIKPEEPLEFIILYAVPEKNCRLRCLKSKTGPKQVEMAAEGCERVLRMADEEPLFGNALYQTKFTCGDCWGKIVQKKGRNEMKFYVLEADTSDEYKYGSQQYSGAVDTSGKPPKDLFKTAPHTPQAPATTPAPRTSDSTSIATLASAITMLFATILIGFFVYKPQQSN